MEFKTKIVVNYERLPSELYKMTIMGSNAKIGAYAKIKQLDREEHSAWIIFFDSINRLVDMGAIDFELDATLEEIIEGLKSPVKTKD